MSEMRTEAPAVAGTSRQRRLFWSGAAISVAMLVVYAIQFSVQLFTTPWYVPIGTTFGVLLMAVATWQNRSVWRVAGAILFGLLCGYEWFALLVDSRVPAYNGPVQAGGALPSFSAVLADGKPFTNETLANGKSTVLLFFRGRW